MSATPLVCAHRGNTAEFPENTWPALRSALAMGVPFIEFDVQLTADGVPVVFHDQTLQRTTPARGLITGQNWDAVRKLSAGEARRFGERFRAVRIPSLEQVVGLLAEWPKAGVFVELKKESIRAFGLPRVMDAVLPRVRPIQARAAIISFERAAVESTPAGLRRGWVLHGFDARWQRQVTALAPDYLFINRTRVPPGAGLWPGPWHWCVYDVADPEEGLALHRRGAQLVETGAVSNYASHPAFARQFR